MTENELIGEIAECLQEALRLQSRVTEVTERVHQARRHERGRPGAPG